MPLQTKRHNPLTPYSQTTNQAHAKPQISQSQQHNQYNPYELPPHASQTQQPRGNHNPHLTQPKASITTPLPNPTTAKGFDDIEVVSPSPSCTKKTRRHLQPDILLPRNKQTAPSNTTTSITWP
jgi:hypothetical protein